MIGLDGQVFPVEGENIAQANINFLGSQILRLQMFGVVVR